MKPREPILIVDDEPSVLHTIQCMLAARGYDHVLPCSDSRRVMPLLDREPIQIMLLDLGLPHVTGEQLLAQILQQYPHMLIIIITACNEDERAAHCLKAGAFDYMVKPFTAERLNTTVHHAVELSQLRGENSALSDHLQARNLQNPEAFAEIITADEQMINLCRYAEAIAPSRQCVLITGETGVGKELFARAIHQASGVNGPFVAVNVAGLDDEMFSDVLFGHKAGAFTNATTPRPGMLEQAANGTLLLDEMGSLAERSQVKLLRLLQENEYMRLGDDQPYASTARIIAATNSNLAQLRLQHRFRNDLYYRLQTHHIHVPPLRERLDTDLPLLLSYFISRITRELHLEREPLLSASVYSLLGEYSYPGNVRELQSMIYDAVSCAVNHVIPIEGIRKHISGLHPASHPPAASAASSAASHIVFPATLPSIKQATRELIFEALRRTNNNQSLAAEMLQITPSALSQRLRKMKNRDTAP